MVSTNSTMDSCKVQVVMEQHSQAEINAFVVDLFLLLPIWVGGADWCPIEILYSLVFGPKFAGLGEHSEESSLVSRREVVGFQNGRRMWKKIGWVVYTCKRLFLPNSWCFTASQALPMADLAKNCGFIELVRPGCLVFWTGLAS
jgi:hypothetical protein